MLKPQYILTLGYSLGYSFGGYKKPLIRSPFYQHFFHVLIQAFGQPFFLPAVPGHPGKVEGWFFGWPSCKCTPLKINGLSLKMMVWFRWFSELPGVENSQVPAVNLPECIECEPQKTSWRPLRSKPYLVSKIRTSIFFKRQSSEPSIVGGTHPPKWSQWSQAVMKYTSENERMTPEKGPV